MVSYIYLVNVNYNGHYMYKIGRCTQDPYYYIKRLKCYPKDSKICFVFIVPDERVVNIEADLIQSMNEKFDCVHGQEYFDGNEKEILGMLTAKMHELYTSPDTTCDKCDIAETKLAKNGERRRHECFVLSDGDKEDIRTALQSPEGEFVVKLSSVAKWLVASKKSLTTTLRLSYRYDIDYQRIRPTDKYYKTCPKVNNYVEYMLTPECFKRVCMMSKGKNADIVRGVF